MKYFHFKSGSGLTTQTWFADNLNIFDFTKEHKHRIKSLFSQTFSFIKRILTNFKINLFEKIQSIKANFFINIRLKLNARMSALFIPTASVLLKYSYPLATQSQLNSANNFTESKWALRVLVRIQSVGFLTFIVLSADAVSIEPSRKTFTK
jgi:hypothetical protein